MIFFSFSRPFTERIYAEKKLRQEKEEWKLINYADNLFWPHFLLLKKSVKTTIQSRLFFIHWHGTIYFRVWFKLRRNIYIHKGWQNLDIVKFFWVFLFLRLSLVPEPDNISCDIVGWLYPTATVQHIGLPRPH